MRFIAAYLLLTLGGNASPSASDISSLLATVDVAADSERIELLLKELEGKDISELIAEGSSKLASVPSGGVAAAGAATGGAAAAAEEAPKEEAPKEEEESDDDMGFGLFD